MMKKLLSMLCVLALTLGLIPAVMAAESVLTAQGWFETICAELTGVTDEQVTAVSYTGADGVETLLEGEDFTYLVRDMEGGVRIDIPGVAAGTYSLSITAGGKVYPAENIQVKAYDRSGYAHKIHTQDAEGNLTGIQDYTEGVGAYNDDGTLKDNAQVIYVTDENRNTVTASFTRNGDPKTITGIGNILNSNNSKVNQGLLEFLSKENHQPLVVRFIGTVTRPEGVSEFKAGASNGGMVYMLSGANVTLEGIGPDATIYGWGFSFGADKDDTQYNKQARNFEARNLSFREVPEDCMEIAGAGNADGSIKESVEHAWIHNCAFYRPSDIANPAEDDKVQGDGAVDYKWGRYMTLSYNYFERCHKTSLIGAGDTVEQYHITWHHNWWKNVESRSPLARKANIHLYNNLYEGQSKYCMSLRANAYIFSEYNTFLNCTDPVKDEGSGGVCKSFGDVFTNCSGANSAQKVLDRDIVVDSESRYASFELSSDLSYIPEGDYLLEENIDDAQTMIAAYTGVMKPLDQITHPEVHHHVWGEWDVEKANTCTEGGHRSRTCTAAGCPLENGLDDQLTVPLGHRWGAWETLKPATCATDGERLHSCTRCNNATDTGAIPALGHKFDAAGVCTVCGGLNTAVDHLFDPASAVSGSTVAADPFFTNHYAVGTLDPNNKSFKDGFKGTYRIKTGSGTPTPTSNSVSFTTSGPATVTVYWVAGGTGRQMVVLDNAGNEVAVTKEESTANAIYTSVLKLDKAGIYHVGTKGGQNYFFGLRVACEQVVAHEGTIGSQSDALVWSYTEEGILNLGGIMPQDDLIIAACWDARGRFAGVKLLDATHMGVELGTGWAAVKLFWTNGEKQQPQCQAVTAWGSVD